MPNEQKVDLGKIYRQRMFKVALGCVLGSALVTSIAMYVVMDRTYTQATEQHALEVQEFADALSEYECQIVDMTAQLEDYNMWQERARWSAALWDRDMMARYLARKEFIYLSEARNIVSHVFDYSEKYNLDPLYMFIFWYSESGGDHRVVSVAKARGYTQVLLKHRGKDVWGDYLVEHNIIERPSDLFDPEVSVNAGGHIFRHYLNESINALPGASYDRILKRTVNRYKGGNDPKYNERISEIFGHYSLWVLTQYANADQVFTMAQLTPDSEPETETVQLSSSGDGGSAMHAIAAASAD